MCNKRILGSCILTLLCAALWSSPPAAAGGVPVGTAFTYSGQLEQGGFPVNGNCDFEFSLWNDPASTDQADQVGATFMQNIDLDNGQFTATLDFGTGIFIGNARWLEIALCCSPADCTKPPANFTTLTPRQELTPAPYSLHASLAASVPWSGLTGVPAGFADDADDDTLGGLSCNDGEIARWNNGTAQWECAVDDAGAGVPAGGIIMWSGSIDTIPEGWALCNGADGTPDLRGMFIVGAAVEGEYVVGHTGGEEAHTLTIREMPSHNHTVQINDATSNGPTRKIETNFITNTYGLPTSHEGGNQPHENRPPFYALAYIVRL